MVRVEGEEMWALLRSLDDPDHLETPAGLDFDATWARFERLVSALDGAFGCACDAERSVQDASLFALVVVPSEATETSERLVVSISSFGPLATVSIVNAGAFDEAEHEALLDPEDARRVHGALDDLGYVVVPEAPLWTLYDGPSQITVDHRFPATWWIRFFDHL